MAVQQFSVFIIIISCLCANVSLGQQQLQFYYCEASGVHVPLEAQCNGVPECPHGEDEQFCGQQQQLFMQEQQEPIEETIPIGLSEDFVKLPAHLQERQFEPNVNGFNNYLGKYKGYNGLLQYSKYMEGKLLAINSNNVNFL